MPMRHFETQLFVFSHDYHGFLDFIFFLIRRYCAIAGRVLEFESVGVAKS